MRTPSLVSILTALLIPFASVADENDAVEKLVRSNNAFAFALFKRLTDGTQSTLLASQSTASALSLAYLGAGGDTAREMREALQLTLPPEKLADAYQALEKRLHSLEVHGQLELRSANGVWLQRGLRFAEGFLRATERFQAAVRRIDFAAAAESARTEINRWTSERTGGKVKELFPASSIDAHTRLVLVAAVYLKGRWENTFKAEATREEPFAIAPDRVVPVPMMSQKAEYGFAETPAFKLLELPYNAEEISMLIALPHAGLKEAIQQLDPADFPRWIAALEKREVRVRIPRFTIKSAFALPHTLKQLGIEAAFSSGKADFSRMTQDGGGLYLSEVRHEAFIEVNEEGTEAAGAAGAALSLRMLREVPEFRADRPFLFFVVDRRADRILFMGCYSGPGE